MGLKNWLLYLKGLIISSKYSVRHIMQPHWYPAVSNKHLLGVLKKTVMNMIFQDVMHQEPTPKDRNQPMLQYGIEWHTQSTILLQRMGQFEESNTFQHPPRSSQTWPDHIVLQNNTETKSVLSIKTKYPKWNCQSLSVSSNLTHIAWRRFMTIPKHICLNHINPSFLCRLN